MAEYAHDGWQQPPPFDYMPDWPVDGHLLTGFAENHVNPPAILGPDDSSFLQGFFRNPNSAPMAEQFNEWPGEHLNIKTDGTGFGQLHHQDHTPQTPHGPPVALGDRPPTSHQLTHSHQQTHVPVNNHMMHYDDHNLGASTYDDVNAMNAAAQLQQMQRVGQRASHPQITAQHVNGVGGGNWPSVEGGYQVIGGQVQQGSNDDLRSPLISSGRQSSHSYHSQQQEFYNTNPLYAEHFPGVMSGAQHPLASTDYHDIQQHNNHSYTTFPGHLVRGASHSAQPRYHNMPRPTSLEYGSDGSFSGGRYEPPPGHVPREAEKGANLNSVPFASHLAAQAHSHAHPFTQLQLSHSQQHHIQPINTNFPNNQSSPNHRGGLPSSTPLSASYHSNFLASDMTRGSIASPAMSDGASDFNESQPRKRRKSGARARSGDSSDEEYTPNSHVKMPKPRRGSKAAKVDNSNNDSATIQHTVTNSKSKPSKRRKMSISGRSSPGSQEYTSPRGDESESPEPGAKTSSRKKRGSIQARNNLTEEEKRQNHIKSEKVRRDLIKQQYDHLDDLVPGLKSGKSGLSRADILLEIVNFVENVARGNERAEQILATMSPSNGGGPSGGAG